MIPHFGKNILELYKITKSAIKKWYIILYLRSTLLLRTEYIFGIQIRSNKQLILQKVFYNGLVKM